MAQNKKLHSKHGVENVRTFHKEAKGLTLFENYITSSKGQKREFSMTQNIVTFIVVEGDGILEYNSKRTAIKPNTLVQAPPGKHLKIIPNSNYIKISGITYNRGFLLDNKISDFHSDVINFIATLHSQIWNLSEEDADKVKDSIARVGNSLESIDLHYFGRPILVHQFHIFLFEIAAITKKHTQLKDLHFSRKEKIAMHFSSLVQQHFRKERLLVFYANEMHLSAKYLAEVIKEVTGRSAVEIINELVTTEAKFLLKQRELNIGEIAELLNFSDQSFFGKFFKRQMGLSPKSFQMKGLQKSVS